MKTPLSAAIALALLTTFAQPVLAQDTATSAEERLDAERLDEIVVTGTRSPKSVDKIPGAVTVVSEAEVQRTLALTEDATAVLARTVPGYSESSQSLSNAGETLRGRTALRLFDGIPQGSPLREGNRQGTFTDMGIVGRIEVINGPSASEGIGAAGGIINYLSKVPTEDGTVGTLSTRYSTQFEDDSEVWKVGLGWTHKNDRFDMIGAASFLDRGIAYDGEDNTIGQNASGSTNDSEADNLFIKLGFNFGEDEMQRVEFSGAKFNITGKGNYTWLEGNRELGIPDQAVRIPPLGSKTEFNDFSQYVLRYMNNDLAGGELRVDLYRADQAMRYPTENGSDRQDPDIAPIGDLIDQSEIFSKKNGVKTSYSYYDLFGAEGLELRAGLDVVEDEAQQRLALTNRIWVPPMNYESKAPWFQLSWDIGNLTLSGGYRREDGELTVDDYTTTWFRDRRFVSGGTLDYKEDLFNFGGIYRIGEDWTVFASYGEGFSLPNVGIPLRNIQCSNDSPDGTQPDGCPNDPPIGVDGIVDLQALVVENREVGFNYRGERFSFGASHYISESDFGSSLVVDPETEDFILVRAPTEIKGYEATAEMILADDWKVSALYSRIRGLTTYGSTGPLIREMGVNDISPDKIGASVDWRFAPGSNVVLGATMLLDRDINEGRGNEEHTTGYTLFDLTANFDLNEYGRLQVGVENLTNRYYILSWAQIDFYRNYFAGRGRVFSVSHTINF
ncbi:TonB-dependent receptor [Chiayiivirga flava]|uniref:Iron complex outermembrane receptor protein n=1 Tax=Chiayiivirga flava TaxID=659595 RepID=A0A7W8D5I9_9GAMM|nr:TonB-dependent receptor [Chiayiivirga flava]MBB5208300.1 iron complex outermembrane receptor protein [Chiayiivirga flava]